MIDFKTQAFRDMRVFHNAKEFAEAMTVYYGGKALHLHGVLGCEGGAARKVKVDDYGQGINRRTAVLYISQLETGFVPERGDEIEIDQSGSVVPYMIEECSVEDGEIILTLGAFDE